MREDNQLCGKYPDALLPLAKLQKVTARTDEVAPIAKHGGGRMGFRVPRVRDVIGGRMTAKTAMAGSRKARIARPPFVDARRLCMGDERRRNTRAAHEAMSFLQRRSPASDFGDGALGASALAGPPKAFKAAMAPKYSK